MGIKSLRVGGNTADRPTVKFPAEKDIDSLFAFAKAANVKVLFTLRLRQGDPNAAAAVAKYICEHYESQLTCFAIGNEPNVFSSEYNGFRDIWKKYADTITTVAPKAKFCGPAATAGKTDWSRKFAEEFADSGKLLLITQHLYPGGNADLVKTPAEGINLMLSENWVKDYEKFAAGFVPTVKAKNLGFRMQETNSFWNGGRKDVSNTFASALWRLDYMFWWAKQGASGVNFHTGDFVAKSETNTRCMYALFWSTPNGYDAHPLSYAVKTFDLGGHGKMIPTEISSNVDNVNLTAYSALASDNSIRITLINKEHGENAKNSDIKINIDNNLAFKQVQIISLTAPNNDVTATANVTMGNSLIDETGNWKGNWTKLSKIKNNQITIRVPASSAIVLKLSKN